ATAGRTRRPRDRTDEHTDAPAPATPRSALRTVGRRAAPASSATSSLPARAIPTAPARRRRRRTGPAQVEEEIGRLAKGRAPQVLRQLMQAADASQHDREREALRILRPLRERLPDSPSVRELVGLCQYRVGNYRAAAKELEAFAELSDSVDQHPVLM